MSGQICSHQWSTKLYLVRFEIGFPQVKTLYRGRVFKLLYFINSLFYIAPILTAFSSSYEPIRHIPFTFSIKLKTQEFQTDDDEWFFSLNFVLCLLFILLHHFYWYGGPHVCFPNTQRNCFGLVTGNTDLFKSHKFLPLKLSLLSCTLLWIFHLPQI